jgi:hypothetical protein
VKPPYTKNAVFAKMPALGALFAEFSQSDEGNLTEKSACGFNL